MDTLSAGIMGMMNRNREQMVFDWDRAAEIVREAHKRFKDVDPDFSVEVALNGDEGNTCGTMYEDGKPNINDGHAYLASTWSRPKLTIWFDPYAFFIDYVEFMEFKREFGLDFEDPDDMDNTNLVAFCYKMQHEVPDWNASTWWPESARAIFNS